MAVFRMHVNRLTVSLRRVTHKRRWNTYAFSTSENMKVQMEGDWQMSLGGNTTSGSAQPGTLTWSKAYIMYEEVPEETLLHATAQAWSQLPYYLHAA